jgi:hypothetical protein
LQAWKFLNWIALTAMVLHVRGDERSRGHPRLSERS